MAKVDSKIEKDNAGWNFENIADDFDEHVTKSVPLYHEGHELICQVSDFFLPENAVVTEIGTSTGALAERFLRHHEGRKDIRYIGLDSVESMVAKAGKRLEEDPRAEFLQADVTAHTFKPCSMVLSYYCMQFIPPRVRQRLIHRIYQSLEWGGAFVLFEKVRAPDARFQDICGQVYQEYKLQKSFSESEILHKQRSLKGVLEPFSTQGNLDLLKRAGFEDVMTMMKWVCFEGFVAIK
jgi:tRNA (cmo5U34)-methyltransferase